MLARATRGARIDRVELRRPDLRRPFPADFASRLTGHTIQSVSRRGKYLLAALSSGETLLVHLGMSGSFRAERPGSSSRTPHPVDPHDHVVIVLSSGVVVTFNDPRRFGLMDLIRTNDEHEALRGMGPEPLDNAFDAMVLARACAGKRVALKVLLLDQRLVAGVGNIYASEALHHARTVAASSRVHDRDAGWRPARGRLQARRRHQGSVAERLWLRTHVPTSRGASASTNATGKPCPRRGCHGTIRRITQAGRSTYFCPVCQR